MTNDELYVSPRFKGDKLASGSLEDKIDVFEDQIKGWALNHAFFLTDASNPSGNHNAGFAILMLCSAYFETIESCFRGRPSKPGESKAFFRAGFLRVFPDLPTKAAGAVRGDVQQEVTKLIDELYGEVRCGLYHGMATKARVLISRTKMPVTFALNNFQLAAIVLDPWAFLEAVGNHLVVFLQDLRNPASAALRKSFELFFDSKRAGVPATLPPNFFAPAKSTF